MNLPHVVRTVGRTEGKREVYLEAYAAVYLIGWKKERVDTGGPVILYGKKEEQNGKTVFIIYAAGEREKVKDAALFGQFQEVGCLNRERWSESGNEYEGILAGDGEGGQPIAGYHIFYEKDGEMKAYLAHIYEEMRKEERIKEAYTGSTQQETYPFQAELTALSERESAHDNPFYSFIRAAVVCIFIILCAIAVSTVNGYEKLKEFTETAVQMRETMNSYEEETDGTTVDMK